MRQRFCLFTPPTIIIGLLVLSGLFYLNYHDQFLLLGRRQSQLAQIMAVETELLKRWQQSFGLKKTLAYNSSGAEVALLQKILSQDENIYPEKKITGHYGNLTKEAVLRFQREYNLPLSGVVDTLTKDKINEVLLQFLCPEATIYYPEFLLNKVSRQQKLPRDYVPPSLENITQQVKTNGIVCVRQELIIPLQQMFMDAKRDGISLAVTSGYRQPDIQQYLYDFWLQLEGPEALDEIAEPGASEHQLGSAIDFTDGSINYAGVDERFGHSPGGRWVATNAHKYGFVSSYPKGKEKITGYEYEPWHYRYVGKELAEQLHERGLTLNEYLGKF